MVEARVRRTLHDQHAGLRGLALVTGRTGGRRQPGAIEHAITYLFAEAKDGGFGVEHRAANALDEFELLCALEFAAYHFIADVLDAVQVVSQLPNISRREHRATHRQ
jgi:hypothetical protein